METLSGQVNVPFDLLSLLRLSQQEMEQEVQRWVALELFRTRKMSAGKTARVHGSTFEQLLQRQVLAASEPSINSAASRACRPSLYPLVPSTLAPIVLGCLVRD